MKTLGRIALTLLACSTGPASAALLTVGPGGAYGTVQAAIDDALATPEDDELRLRAGTFIEQIEIAGSDLGGRLEISGGWDATFSLRDPTPGATVLDGDSAGRVLTADFVDSGELVLRGLTFRHGLAGAAPAAGGGLRLSVSDIVATLEECHFDSNLATVDQGALGASGGGAAILAAGGAEVRLVAVTFTGNEVFIDDEVGAPLGGGVRLSASGSAKILMRHGIASGNILDGGSQRRGGGLSLNALDSSTIEVEDFLVTDNHGDTLDAGEVQGHGLDASAGGSALVALRRLEVTDNWNGGGDVASQVRASLFDGALQLSDTLVARGGTGIDAQGSVAATGASLRLTNLTITDHQGVGVVVNVGSPSSGTVTNTIAWDNAGGNLLLLGGAATGSFNLVGVDPLFVDAGSGDYRLSPLSDALDAGTAAPPGGLGPFDLEHFARIAGTLPDQGAYERDALFADDFERADLAAWPATTP